MSKKGSKKNNSNRRRSKSISKSLLKEQKGYKISRIIIGFNCVNNESSETNE